MSNPGVNNVNAAGSQATGRREINWDGGGAAANATIFPTPMNTFNSGATTRGLESTTPGFGLEISGQPAPEFGEIIDVLFFVPAFNNGLSFLGLISSDAIGRVRIVAGNTALSANANDGGPIDVVALDDFIYGEPSAVEGVPEPVSLSLLGIGVGAFMLNRLRPRAGSH